jgi:hypothetical protein
VSGHAGQAVGVTRSGGDSAREQKAMLGPCIGGLAAAGGATCATARPEDIPMEVSICLHDNYSDETGVCHLNTKRTACAGSGARQRQ